MQNQSQKTYGKCEDGKRKVGSARDFKEKTLILQLDKRLKHIFLRPMPSGLHLHVLSFLCRVRRTRVTIAIPRQEIANGGHLCK